MQHPEPPHVSPPEGWKLTSIALHSWTLGQPTWPDLIEAARLAGYDAIEVTWGDFERAREAGLPLGEIRARLRDADVGVAVVGVKPGWLFAEAADGEPWVDAFRRTGDLAVEVGCRVLMSALGQTSGSLAAAERNMRTAARQAESLGASLAMEFNVGHPVFPSPAAVRDLVAQAGSSACGLVLDSYHLHRSGRPGGDFDEIEPAEIMHVQVSDTPATPLEPGPLPLDRLAPGSGEVDWDGFFRRLRHKAYTGPISYEAPNPLHWRADQVQTARTGIRAIHALLDRAGWITPRSPSSG